MKGKSTYTKVSQLRYDSFQQKYQGSSGQVLSAFDGIIMSLFPPCRALVFLLLAETHWKRNLKEPIIRHLYQFPNVPGTVWLSWTVDDDGSSNLSGLVVKLYTTGID